MRSIFDIWKSVVKCRVRSLARQIATFPSCRDIMILCGPAWAKSKTKWHGEGLGSLTLMAIEAFMKPRRKAVDMYDKQKLLRSQNYRCNRCGEHMRTCEADHIISCSVGGTELQALCPECHQAKSNAEQECHRP